MTSMSPLFGKRQELQAFAVTLENGRKVAGSEMTNIANFRDPLSRYGKHITYGIKVRVQVKYDPKNNRSVTFDDDPQAIQARNPQLDPSERQGWLNELLKKEMGR